MHLIVTLIIFIFSICHAKTNETPYTVYIKPKSKLFDLEKNEYVKNYEGFYAKVLELDPSKRDEFTIYSESLIPKYKVGANDIVEFQSGIELLPNERGNIIYPPKSQFQTKNLNVPFESEFVLSFDQLNFSEINNYLDTDLTSNNAPRYKINTLYKSNFSINSGLALNYQSSAWVDDLKLHSRLNILSLGPEFKFIFLDDEGLVLSSQLSYEFCPIYEISSSAGKDQFQAYLWNIGLHSEYETRIGKITAGIDLRKHYLTYEGSTKTTRVIRSEEYTITGIGLFVGYKFNWSL